MAKQSKQSQADAIIQSLKVGSQLTQEMIDACGCVQYAKFYPVHNRRDIIKKTTSESYNPFRHNIEYDEQTFVVTLIWKG